MTQLELAAEVGSGTMEVVKMYLNGRLTARELAGVLGEKKAMTVVRYERERK